MTEDKQLHEQLRRLSIVGPQTAGPAFEETIRRAFRARLSEKGGRWNYALKIAAAVVIAAGLYMLWDHRKTSEQPLAATTLVHQRSDFFALPYAQSEVPLEQPVIVRVQIPVSELSGMGIPSPDFGVKGKVSADLLVGQDGVARAVRLVE